MGEWGYVWLAYGVAWATLVVYTVYLNRRAARARARLKDLQS